MNRLTKLKQSRLQQLITATGGKARLAEILCLPEYHVRDWIRNGQISPVGALLVDTTELASLLGSEMLRPELPDEKWAKVKRSDRYLEAREKQKIYQVNPIESPIKVIRELMYEN